MFFSISLIGLAEDSYVRHWISGVLVSMFNFLVCSLFGCVFKEQRQPSQPENFPKPKNDLFFLWAHCTIGQEKIQTCQYPCNSLRVLLELCRSSASGLPNLYSRHVAVFMIRVADFLHSATLYRVNFQPSVPWPAHKDQKHLWIYKVGMCCSADQCWIRFVVGHQLDKKDMSVALQSILRPHAFILSSIWEPSTGDVGDWTGLRPSRCSPAKQLWPFT